MEEQAAAEAQEQHHADPGHRHPRIDTSFALHINDGRVNHRWALRALQMCVGSRTAVSTHFLGSENVGSSQCPVLPSRAVGSDLLLSLVHASTGLVKSLGLRTSIRAVRLPLA